MKSHTKFVALCEGAVMVALAQTLSFIKLFELPNGGSVCVGALPIFIYCTRWGLGPGFLSGFAYGLLQLLLDGAYAWGWQSIIGDYLLAFTALGFAGLFSKTKNGFFTGMLAGSLARFIITYIVGAVIWSEYMPESFFGMTMTSPWIYSALYNGSYMLLNLIMCLIIGKLIMKPLGKYIHREDAD